MKIILLDRCQGVEGRFLPCTSGALKRRLSEESDTW